MKISKINNSKKICKMFLRSFLSKCQVRSSRGFKSESSRGNLGVRFRHRRPSHVPSQVLLDKFVKHTKVDGSLVVKAPFSLKVKGSYFDTSFNVDRERNRQMLFAVRGLTLNNSSSSLAKRDVGAEAVLLQPKDSPDPKVASRDELFALENNILDSLVKNLSKDFTKQLKDDANLLKQSNNGGSSRVSKTDDEKTEVEHRLDEKSPLHVLLYGRSNHQVDSYSVLNAKNQHQSYLYISESSQYEDAESMFVHLEPTATVSIWQPTSLERGTHILEDEMVSGFKIFCPYHLLDTHENQLKAVFLVPVSMGKIYLQSDREGHIELDGSLLEDLLSVGLYTEIGNLRVRDLSAVEIKLASRMGDILCEGSLDGHSVAETFGDGDFLARSLEGPSFKVTTEDGDIHVWNDCRSEVSNFTTRRGQIHIRDLYNQSTMEVTETGNITTNIVSGSLNAFVERGGIFVAIESLTDDSVLRVQTGEINVTLPQKSNFRIHASAPRTNISPRLLNSGEIFLSEQTGHETFVTQAVGQKSENFPTLTLVANNGSINIIMTQTEEEKVAAEGYDSV